MLIPRSDDLVGRRNMLVATAIWRHTIIATEFITESAYHGFVPCWTLPQHVGPSNCGRECV
jgi:hypothetical protein